MSRGLAPEVWTPLLLVYLIDIVNSALGGRPDWRKSVPWLAPDEGPPEMQLMRRRAQRMAASRRAAVEMSAGLLRRASVS